MPVFEYMTKGNVIQNMPCKACGSNYSCTLDFKTHLSGDFHKNIKENPLNSSEGKLTPNDLNKLPWKAFRSGKGWWIYSEDAPYLRDAIQNGNNVIGGYKYFLYGGNKCIGRSLNKTGCY